MHPISHQCLNKQTIITSYHKEHNKINNPDCVLYCLLNYKHGHVTAIFTQKKISNELTRPHLIPDEPIRLGRQLVREEADLFNS